MEIQLDSSLPTARNPATGNVDQDLPSTMQHDSDLLFSYLILAQEWNWC